MRQHWKLLILIFCLGIFPALFSTGFGSSTKNPAEPVSPKQTVAAHSVDSPADTHHPGDEHTTGGANFPRPLASYGDEDEPHLGKILANRIKQEPFNLVATAVFALAILHTFFSSIIAGFAHRINHHHEKLVHEGKKKTGSVNVFGELLHFFGEVEAVFGIWAGVLLIVITLFFDWHTATSYIAHSVNFTEPMFIVAIMILASSRPVLKLAELAVQKIANIFGGSLAAWWMAILIITPLLGSFITEPAAITITAMLLSQKFYDLEPSLKFRYATLGLLFVNVSVGGTLTHFAAPPVLMVAGKWGWGFDFMLSHFGWKAALGVVIATTIYYFYFKKEIAVLSKKFARVRLKEIIEKNYFRREHLEEELGRMDEMIVETGFPITWEMRTSLLKSEIRQRIEAEFESKEHIDEELFNEVFSERFEEARIKEMRRHLPGLLPAGQRPEIIDPDWDRRPDKVPAWIMIVHVGFLVWTVWNAHYPPLFIAGLLFFIGFAAATSPFQNRLDLKQPLMVGFFLAGLVIHGGLQGWWISPILGSLAAVPLMISATILTAFNDNAAITYLSSLVPNFSAALKYAVVAGAVTGGGLTVIANAPNPAGQAILKKYFPNQAVSPAGLFKAAIFPTLVIFLIFVVFFE